MKKINSKKAISAIEPEETKINFFFDFRITSSLHKDVCVVN